MLFLEDKNRYNKVFFVAQIKGCNLSVTKLFAKFLYSHYNSNQVTCKTYDLTDWGNLP